MFKPHCHCCLNTLDFFLQGYVESNVYSTKPRSVEELHAGIVDVIEGIIENQMQNVF